MTATLTLVEGSGFGQRRAVTSIQLLGVDGFDQGAQDYLTYPVIVVPTSGLVTTYERWFRFEFSGSYSSVSDLRFWAPGLVVNNGWTLNWGLADEYRQPAGSQSDVAVSAVPTGDPGSPNLDFVDAPDDLLNLETRNATQWIVLQAVASQDAPALLSASSVSYELAWLEY